MLSSLPTHSEQITSVITSVKDVLFITEAF